MTNSGLQLPGDPARQLQIIYTDEAILAVNKPAGLSSLPDGYDPSAPHLKSLLEPKFGRLWIVHRLDRDTSGIVLLARSAAAHQHLNTQFELRQVAKRYQAIICGRPDWTERLIRLPLRPDGDRRHRTVVDLQRGKPAETTFRILGIFARFAWLEAIPHTGRTHQIRAHLAAIDLPILGDQLYGGGAALFLSDLKPGFSPGAAPECPLIQRTALHAHSLDFVHPASATRLHLQATYPKDFNAALRMLQRYPG
jgi:RluA family pseudouridine synthase